MESSFVPRRLLFFGMTGIFSRVPLARILAAGAEVQALVLARPSADDEGPIWLPSGGSVESELPMLGSAPQGIHQIAAKYRVPVLSVGSLKDPATLSELADLSPDLIVISCFPRLFPGQLLDLPKEGCLNLHPSLLPAYRGPAPIFWQLHEGEENTGISLHFINAEIDSGDLVAQVKVPLPFGASAAELDTVMAEAGAGLILDILRQPQIPCQPQPREDASYHKQPVDSDKRVAQSWSAHRAYHFMRGADEWAPFEIETPEREWLTVWEALDMVNPGEEKERAPEGSRWVDLSEGSVLVSVE